MEDRNIIIHYHTSKTKLPDPNEIELGEVVIMHNPEKTEIILKDNNGDLHEIIDSKSMKSILESSIESLINEIKTNSIDVIMDKIKSNEDKIIEQNVDINNLDDKISVLNNEIFETRSLINNKKIINGGTF